MRVCTNEDYRLKPEFYIFVNSLQALLSLRLPASAVNVVYQQLTGYFYCLHPQAEDQYLIQQYK